MPFYGDAVAHTVRWDEAQPIHSGELLRLRLFLRKAEIVNLQFVEAA